ncbi:MAG: ADP-ribose diphosphatase [archaeon GW2011_AR13]|nr:MAG: ADP-ribose diphosphatase [archaeon GW2011_AR13]HIG94620.1 NUDIX domain-containing protein [Nanoarchaeota archaeon]HIH63359.1 NUDIX domain-containing protein [Nanoarchaeota archaeon]HIJ09983.1 NUDIX domain-containing protein [Nanoarchaeota archaeon]
MEEKILSAFLYNKKLKFSEIEKSVKTRSNKLAYHIKKLENQGILIKEKEFYSLSEFAQKIIPYLSSKQSALPVILIAIKEKEKVFLIKRKKRPFLDKLSLPGGRLLVGEEISDSVKRIMKEKFSINAKLSKINSVSLEHTIKNKKKIHSFLLIFVTATTKDKINYLTLNKKEMITSDYELIKNNLNKEIKINTFLTDL